MIAFLFGSRVADVVARDQVAVNSPPSEETALLNVIDNEDGQNSTNENEPVEAEPTQSPLWNELEQPWPSTFERSISLLASPKITKAEADIFTRSPHPGCTPAALYIRERLRQSHMETPEAARPQLRFTVNGAISASERRIHGPSSATPRERWDLVADIEKEQQQKLKKAQKYRESILGKVGVSKTTKRDVNTSVADGTRSPGFGREQAALLAGKKRMEQQSEAMISQSKSSSLQCVFNLANILMGVGLLGLPYAISRAGWFGGLACLVLFGLIAWRTSILIGRELNGDHRPVSYFHDQECNPPVKPGSRPEARMRQELNSFPAIARAAFGETGCIILSITLYFELFSCICIFFVSIGDHMYLLFPSVSTSTHVLIVGVLSMVPTIVLRTPALLSYLSMVGTVATVAVCISVVASAFTLGDVSETTPKQDEAFDDEPAHRLWDASGVLVTLGLVAYCFSGHAIVPSIYTSMRHPQDFETMCTVTFLIVMLCCAAVGSAGYYMFGSTVLDQITLSLQQNSPSSGVMSILTSLMVTTAFSKITLTMFPLALGMEELVAPHLTSEFWVDVCSSFIKLLLTSSAVFVAICIPSFSTLCALVGLICTMVVSVIFPSAAYLKLFGSKLSLFDKVSNVAFVILGLVVAIVGTLKTLA